MVRPRYLALSTRARLFADDCLLYRPIKIEADATKLQEDIDALQNGDGKAEVFGVVDDLKLLVVDIIICHDLITLVGDKVESIQRRAARFVTNNYDPRASVTTLLQDLNWPTLQHRRQLAKLIMMYRITYHLIEIPSITYLIPSCGSHTVEAYSSDGRTNVL
jgi:hypothetical protein